MKNDHPLKFFIIQEHKVSSELFSNSSRALFIVL